VAPRMQASPYPCNAATLGAAGFLGGVVGGLESGNHGLIQCGQQVAVAIHRYGDAGVA
jgi:hypothetical protein